MRKQKVYLETTIFNFYFAEDAKDKINDTIRLFDEISTGKFEPYTSEYVIDELLEASEEKKEKMLNLIRNSDIKILEADNDVLRLAEKYIQEGVIPQKYSDDAYHIAVAAVYDMDIIISYNFKHIVKLKTKTMTKAINKLFGYKEVEIVSPAEVIDDD